VVGADNGRWAGGDCEAAEGEDAAGRSLIVATTLFDDLQTVSRWRSHCALYRQSWIDVLDQLLNGRVIRFASGNHCL
jgi:hypothetical protein